MPHLPANKNGLPLFCLMLLQGLNARAFSPPDLLHYATDAGLPATELL